MAFEFTDSQLSAIRAACLQFGVRRLDLFGSAMTDHFDPQKSDLDFAVEFVDPTGPAIADNYFGLMFALEDLFALKIDLVDLTSKENPYFAQAVATTLHQLYAA